MTDILTEALWHRGELSYKLHGKQTEIYKIMRESAGDTTVLAARRFGKSHLMAVFACEEAIRNPSSRIILLAPNKSQAYDIYTPIIRTISKDAPKGFVRPTKSESKWHVGESELIFAGFDTIAESLRGGGSILVIFDEVAFVIADEYEYVTKSIIYPMLQKTIGKKAGRKIWISTPAKTPDHPFNKHWETVEKEGKLHRYTIYDNPILSAQDIQDAINEQGGADSIGFRREYLCENVRDPGGLIIPKFEMRHILKPKEELSFHVNKWIVADGGGTRDKTVILVLGRQLQDNKIVILDEAVFEPNTDITEIGRMIKQLQTNHDVLNHHIWMDAHGQTLVDLYKICKISAPLPPKQDKDAAISALNAAFFMDEVFVAKNCQFLTLCLRNCMFNEKRTDFLRSEVYGHADAIMAAVYGYRVSQFVMQPKILTSSRGSDYQINLRREGSIYSEITEKIKPSKVLWQK